jgi:hypothetical protein
MSFRFCCFFVYAAVRNDVSAITGCCSNQEEPGDFSRERNTQKEAGGKKKSE